MKMNHIIVAARTFCGLSLSWWLTMSKLNRRFRSLFQRLWGSSHHNLQSGSFRCHLILCAHCATEPFCFRGCGWERGWCQTAASFRGRLGSWTKPALCGRLLQSQGNFACHKTVNCVLFSCYWSTEPVPFQFFEPKLCGEPFWKCCHMFFHAVPPRSRWWIQRRSSAAH